MMVHGTIDGIVFSEYVKIDEGQAIVERIDSNIKCNMQYELSKVDANIDDIFDALEEGAQEVFQSFYMNAYAGALVDLIPVYDVGKDKKSPFPWCSFFFRSANAETLEGLKTLASEKACDDSPCIAELLAEELEETDGMPRIVLVHGNVYNVYDINNLIDVFGRCENGLDFEAIKSAFNHSEKMIDFDAFKDLAGAYDLYAKSEALALAD